MSRLSAPEADPSRAWRGGRLRLPIAARAAGGLASQHLLVDGDDLVRQRLQKKGPSWSFDADDPKRTWAVRLVP